MKVDHALWIEYAVLQICFANFNSVGASSSGSNPSSTSTSGIRLASVSLAINHADWPAYSGWDSQRTRSRYPMLDHGATRFSEGSPPYGTSTLLCEDDRVPYVLPFLCEFRGGGWHNARGKTSVNVIAAKVVGWRLLPD